MDDGLKGGNLSGGEAAEIRIRRIAADLADLDVGGCAHCAGGAGTREQRGGGEGQDVFHVMFLSGFVIVGVRSGAFLRRHQP